MSASLALQEPIKVAYLGPEGTFSHAAARQFFGLAVTYSEATTFDGVFDAVSRHQAVYGVVPVENSSEGTVPHAVDALVSGDLLIRAEFDIEGLAVPPRARVGPARGRAGSARRPEVLGQCRVLAREKTSGALSLVQAPSTAAAVREALTDPQGAAIASRLASELYGLPVMRERVQDRAENHTRFVVVGHEDAARTGDDKTTVAFSLRDGRGALMRALAVFDEEGISLSHIESRPSREKSWEYVFLADLLGHREDASVVRAMARLRETCPMVKHLEQLPASTPFGVEWPGVRRVEEESRHGFRSYSHRGRRGHRPGHSSRRSPIAGDEDYLVLEAEREIGGWCKTVKKDGFVWDYSGHFFHFKHPEIEQWLRDRMPGRRSASSDEKELHRLQGAVHRFPLPEEHPSAPARRVHRLLARRLLRSIERRERRTRSAPLHRPRTSRRCS